MLTVAVLEPSPLQKYLTRLDTDELLNIATAVLGRHKKAKRESVKFVWREYPLIARRTPERMIIEDTMGRDVACRWEWHP